MAAQITRHEFARGGVSNMGGGGGGGVGCFGRPDMPEPAPEPHVAPSAGHWKLVWCHERCFMAQNSSQRRQFAEGIRSSGGRLVCMKRPHRLEQWLGSQGARVYAVMLDWSQCKTVLRLLTQWPGSNLPKYVIVRCERSGTTQQGMKDRAEAQAWLRRHHNLAGTSYLLSSDFDLRINNNMLNIIDEVSKIAMGRFEALLRSPLRLGLQELPVAAHGPAQCLVGQDQSPAEGAGSHRDVGIPKIGSDVEINDSGCRTTPYDEIDSSFDSDRELPIVSRMSSDRAHLYLISCASKFTISWDDTMFI
mmetsp:Transcript_37229/g.119180  ORF Transcript_37229/g.119180 Transcript_37229/m.119180 type:complete len:305 (-) Transcript_37229:121-1035(-)